MSSRKSPEARDEAHALLRELPSVDEVLQSPRAHGALGADFPRGLLTHHVRHAIDGLRREILANGRQFPQEALSADAVARRALRLAVTDGRPLPRVINGTGVILHSGLGRAPISQAAADAIRNAAGYSLLEVDRNAGDRLSRDTRVGILLRELVGCEASLVVNNNAAATMLILRAMAAGREVICSRGEMVEIGGSYRIPDVMEASGCQLVEVGTTNRTHARDYENAITENTAALLVVHTSNYRIVGFTKTPELSEIAAIGRRHGIPVIHDLGSGSLLGPEELGLGDEPPVMHSLKQGADVVCMSGDKLLGGPQAGIILGRKDLIQKMRKDSMARALRIDKMQVAALEATLQLFFDKDRLLETHPVVRMISGPVEALRPRAEMLVKKIEELAPEGTIAEIVDSSAETGSGALPTLQIPSVAVAIEHPAMNAVALGRALRHATVGVFTRIVKERVQIDLRTLFPGEEAEAATQVAEVLKAGTTP